MATVRSQIIGRRGGARKGTKVLSITMPNAAAGATQNVFVADQAYRVVSIEYCHAVRELTAASAALTVTAPTATQGVAAGNDLLATSTSFDMKGSKNVVNVGTLNATEANLKIANGDRIALLVTGGAMTEYAGGVVTIVLVPETVPGGDTGDKRYWISEV